MSIDPGRHIDIMGIVNLTDDSFFAGSRILESDGSLKADSFRRRVDAMLADGASIMDLGACSTRPGSSPVDEETEWARLEPALEIAAKEYSGTSFSIDTFRPEIVRRAHEAMGPFIVNDVTGGSKEMLSLVGDLGLTYIATHPYGTETLRPFFEEFSRKAEKAGIKDWILDPGFGFGKDVSQNWELLRNMLSLRDFGHRILAGVSRKRFIRVPLGLEPDEALSATQVVHLACLRNGADILRVHDVKESAQTVRLYQMLYS